MHFKLDENIPLQLGRLIKTRGHEFSSVYSEKIMGVRDAELLNICKKKEYILITLDNDFANVQAHPLSSHGGVIVFRLKSQGTLSIIGAFENFLKTVNLLMTKNSLIIVEKEHIRVRT